MNCLICLDNSFIKKLSVPFDPKIKAKYVSIQLPCFHEICRDCMTVWCKDYVLKNRDKEFRCPDCNHLFDPYGIVTKKELSDYVKRNERNTMIACPKPKCDGNIVKTGSLFRCQKCMILLCKQCFDISHEGECNKDTILSVQAILKDSKPCPKCNLIIYKDGGCDHMYCISCKTHFNWMTSSTNEDDWNPAPINFNARLEELGIQGVEMIRRIHIREVIPFHKTFFDWVGEEDGCLMCKSGMCKSGGMYKKNVMCCWCSERNKCSTCKL